MTIPPILSTSSQKLHVIKQPCWTSAPVVLDWNNSNHREMFVRSTLHRRSRFSEGRNCQKVNQPGRFRHCFEAYLSINRQLSLNTLLWNLILKQTLSISSHWKRTQRRTLLCRPFQRTMLVFAMKLLSWLTLQQKSILMKCWMLF